MSRISSPRIRRSPTSSPSSSAGPASACSGRSSRASRCSRTFRYAQNALLFLIVFTAVRERKHAVWVLAAFVAGSTISAMFAIMNPVDPGQYDVARASGTIGDPNELASVLVVGIILGVRAVRDHAPLAASCG